MDQRIWNPAEEGAAVRMHKAGYSPEMISLAMPARSARSIADKLTRLGWLKPKRHPDRFVLDLRRRLRAEPMREQSI